MRTVTSTDGTTIAFDRTGRLGAHPGGRCGLRSVVRAERHLGELIASDRRAQAVRHFMRKGVGLPAFVVGMMRLMPAWSRLKAVAHTLPYDAAVLGEETGAGMPLPTDRWASVTVPTLVARGGKSPDRMRNAAAALAALLGAELRTLEGQTHIVKPKALAPVLAEFFAAESGSRRVEHDLRAASVVSV
jgi:pimeloyl-ACP methyl ester carboxylesterase